jgi:hypothetical protein
MFFLLSFSPLAVIIPGYIKENGISPTCELIDCLDKQCLAVDGNGTSRKLELAKDWGSVV